jgi:membrane protease YdiL (CAAX protease family)
MFLMTTMITTRTPASTSSLKTLLARHPLRSYFTIAYMGAWIPLAVPVLAQNGLGVLPFTVSDIAFVLLFILATFAGPTMGALVVTAATEGRPGLRRFLRRYVQVRFGIRWYLVALFGFPLLGLFAASVYLGAAPFVTALTQWSAIFTTYLPAVLAMMIIPALGEEPGWRGFALPRLEQLYGPLVGSLVLGLLHGVWHLPVFLLITGPAAMGPFSAGHFVWNTFMIMSVTVLWTWVFNNARGSIFAAILLHAAFNAAGALMRQWFPAFPASANSLGDYLIVASAVLVVLGTRGQLSYGKLQDLSSSANPKATE